MDRWRDEHIVISSVLFTLQVVHLIWLLVFVVLPKLGVQTGELPRLLEYIIIVVDYTEIPALILTTLLYIGEWNRDRKFKNILYILFLNTQWIHLFWITDEFVVSSFASPITMAPWLAWVAIAIDYLEVPVMYETIKKALSLKKGKAQ